jgi:serine/threonine protein kinase
MTIAADTELVETLGEGAFGTVYVARIKDGAIERTVVLKVLKDNWSENSEIVSRARDEAVMLARLNHDSIVKVETSC